MKIYHNPRCSKSRQTLEIINEVGADAEIIEYLKTPPSRDELLGLLEMLGMQPRELMRKGEAEYKDNDLGNPDLDNNALIDAMLQFPKLIERPIVVNNGKAVIGRPPVSVKDIL